MKNVTQESVFKLLLTAFPRFSLNVTYYCLSFNVGNLGLDIFLTQAMFGLSELPAHILCIWLLEAVGRKVSLMATLLIGGFLCILILAVPQGKAELINEIFSGLKITFILNCIF